MLKLLHSKQNLNNYKKWSCILQLLFYFVNMNLVSIQAFHAQSKSIFICVGNTSPYFFCSLISLKYFCFIKAFYSFPYLFLADSPLCSTVLVVPSPLYFHFEFLQNEKSFPFASKFTGGQGSDLLAQKLPRRAALEVGSFPVGREPHSSSHSHHPALPFRSSGNQRKDNVPLAQPPALGLCSEGLDKAGQ